MAALSGMTGEQLSAWAAGNDQSAVASPLDASPPPAEQEAAPVDADAVAEAPESTDTPPVDIEAMARELADLKAKDAERDAEIERQQAEAEQAKAAQAEKVAEDLRVAEHQEFVKNLRELHDIDPEAAQKVAQHRSFVEQDRDHFKRETAVNAKMVDAISLAIETLLPKEQVSSIVEYAKTLMPYQSYEDMRGYIGTQQQREATTNERIAQLEAELAEARRAEGAHARNPLIDQVERSGGSTGPVGLPGSLGAMSGQQLAEWARQAPTATY